MKYFLIETDERNRIPYGINSNRELDIRLLNREQIDTLPQWNMVNMSLPMEVFFPDIISHLLHRLYPAHTERLPHP